MSPGFYDSNDNMVISWTDLVTKIVISVDIDDASQFPSDLKIYVTKEAYDFFASDMWSWWLLIDRVQIFN